MTSDQITNDYEQNQEEYINTISPDLESDPDLQSDLGDLRVIDFITPAIIGD